MLGISEFSGYFLTPKVEYEIYFFKLSSYETQTAQVGMPLYDPFSSYTASQSAPHNLDKISPHDTLKNQGHHQ